MKKNIIKATAEEILNSIDGNEEWDGPSGKMWCKNLNRYVDPSVDNKKILEQCPECAPLFTTDDRTYRYLHLHDDYKSFGS